jgi:hypothetical protein
MDEGLEDDGSTQEADEEFWGAYSTSEAKL